MPISAQRPLILVVDDHSTNVQVLGRLLEEHGYDVMPAVSGAQALARAQARKPDLVLLDLLMMPMDGFELCRRLHGMPALADVPVIFVTAATNRESLVNAFAAGAVDYVTKPFLTEELLARIRTHVELKRTRDRLSAMLQEREDVTHVVAHDLKNPLTSIRFSAQLLLRTGNDAARRAELAQEIRQAAEEALQFIQRFLARGAEGRRLRQLAAQPGDLRSLAQEALHRQIGAADARAVTLRLRGESAVVSADPIATRNVLQNLISNAIKHSPAGGEVEIAVGPGRPGFSQCLVMDRGPGVAPEEQERLFQRFLRLATAKSADDYSSGLGLAIAKHDVSLMGGYLWYEPRSGGGSVFGFELPQEVPVSGAA
ncbi:MAG: hybrid sensor histidine kinase/response regulator [Gammaproteobacteria bacterium]|nr:hybrid sensor histidine kinase/response regulator [Gammaproteobacteria bacterium]